MFEESKKSLPLVSVIVPVYNVEDYLDDCISSILNQTYQHTEIILIDDGSTDSSGAICDKYSEKIDNIVAIHKNNGGLSDARNTGLSVVKGEYILFVDSDDSIEKNAIQLLIEVAIKSDNDVVISYKYNTIANGGIKRERYIFPESIKTNNPKKFGLEIIIRRGRSWSVCTKLYKTSIIVGSDASFPLGRISEDVIFNLQVFSKAKKIGFVNEAFYNYFQRENSISHSFQKKYFDDILYIDTRARTFVEECFEHPKKDELEAPDTLLWRNVVLYLISVFRKTSGLSAPERNMYFDKIMSNEKVQVALQNNFSDLYFAQQKHAAKFCLIIKNLLQKKHYSIAKFLLLIAGRF